MNITKRTRVKFDDGLVEGAGWVVGWSAKDSMSALVAMDERYNDYGHDGHYRAQSHLFPGEEIKEDHMRYFYEKHITIIPELQPGDKVWVSDISEELARKNKYERILLAILPENVNNRFICQTVDSPEDWMSWNYAVPVERDAYTLTVTKNGEPYDPTEEELLKIKRGEM